MRPYYQDSAVTIYHGDCREVLPSLAADRPYAVVVSDPPYGVNIADWDREVPPQEILGLCLAIGPCLWFGAAVPRRLFAFAGYDPQPDRCIVWHATFSLAATAAHGMYYRWHPIWLWAKGEKVTLERDVIEEPCDGHNGWYHPGTKPLALMKRLVAAMPPGAVIDPFVGSGTTVVAAKDLGRKAIGIEIEERYCEIAARRCAQEVMEFVAQPTEEAEQ